MTVYAIPLKPRAQTLEVDLGAAQYYVRLLYCDVLSGEGGWILDVASSAGVILLAGLPLVTGGDLLEPYAYLGIGVKLFVITPGMPYLVPSYTALGVTSLLCWTTDLAYDGFRPVVSVLPPVFSGSESQGMNLTTDDDQMITDDSGNLIVGLG